jgi:N-acetylmuramoyl-L-alanine amidase CwlA
MQINTSMVNTHNTYVGGKTVDYIVIHYTAGTTSKSGAAKNTLTYFNNIQTASATFCVDDANVMQYTDYEAGYRDWHCGEDSRSGKGGGTLYGKCTNMNSIGIEVCSTNSTGKVTSVNTSSWYFTDAVLENAAWLVKYLLSEYPNARVVRHYDVSGKICPGVPGWNSYNGADESKWKAFLTKCGCDSDGYKTSTSATSTSSSAGTTSTALYRVRKAWSDAKSQIGAYKSLSNAKNACKKGYSVFDANGNAVYEVDSAGAKWNYDATLETGNTVKSKVLPIAAEDKTNGWYKITSLGGYVPKTDVTVTSSGYAYLTATKVLAVDAANNLVKVHDYWVKPDDLAAKV